MKKIELKAFAKINLSLDVQGLLPNGFHRVEMIMQQILLCDDIIVKWSDQKEESQPHNNVTVSLSTNKYFLPSDERNLAYKAALMMIDRFSGMIPSPKHSGHIRIDIKKRIPVAAGLAGGSSNCAAVIHALNKLWSLELTLDEMCELGSMLGSDVPFCIMGQAAANDMLRETFSGDPLCCHCALATGTGTELHPITGLKSHLVLSKPAISVSTAEVYRGIDKEEIPEHPDNHELIKALDENNSHVIKKNMINVLENFTLKRYPIVMYTKNKMQNLCNSNGVLMSGSGPTIFGLCSNINESKKICQEMLKYNKETFWTRTTW